MKKKALSLTVTNKHLQIRVTREPGNGAVDTIYQFQIILYFLNQISKKARAFSAFHARSPKLHTNNDAYCYGKKCFTYCAFVQPTHLLR